MNNESAIKIGKKSFLTSFFILLSLIIFVGALTRIIPAGSYDRMMLDGREVIDASSFHYVDGNLVPIWSWFTAPFEVLAGEDSIIVIMIIVFLVFIGGSIAILNESNVLNSIIGKVVKQFGDKKYMLMAVMLFVFMSFGAFIGMFEEVIPLIPIVIALCYCFGWDDFVGLGIVVLGAGFGFTAAVSNPFTIGIAQKMADLPIFSGSGYRLIIFLVVYIILFLYLSLYAKKIEKKNDYDLDATIRQYDVFMNNKALDRAVKWFVFMLILLFSLLIAGSFIPFLSDIALPLVGLIFFIGGIGAGLFSGIGGKKTVQIFVSGALAIAPAIILILMASSIKYIINSAGVMDTILYQISLTIQDMSPYVAVATLFVIIFFMDFLIGSGSAKAFLIMPLVVPLADIIGVNRQIMVLAFQFGDGFSNVVFPTNPVLLISLGLAAISYTRWIKWLFKLEIIILVVSLLFLELAVLFNYGPF